jgi:hypothetical protein
VAHDKGAIVNRPQAVRARKSAPPPAATNRMNRSDVIGGVRPFRGKYHAWNVEFTHLRTDDRYGSQSPSTCSENLEAEDVPTQLSIWEDLRVTRCSTYIDNFLAELVDKAQAHSHEENVAMANAIIDIWLSGKDHQEQTEDLQE